MGKGFELVTMGLIAVAVVVSMFMVVMPIFFLKIHLINIINYEYKYDNAQLSLLVLLSSIHNGKFIYSDIAENVGIGKADVGFLDSKLEKITGNDCFKLSAGTKVLSNPNDCKASKFTAQTKLVLPYNPTKLVEDLKLVIEK